MKNWQTIFLVAVIATMSIGLTACGSDSNDVPSLGATPTAVAEDEIFDIEAKMMEFTECLRAEGLEVMDPVVDSDGNVQLPEYNSGVEVSKKELEEAYEVCGELLEGITFGKEKYGQSGQGNFYGESGDITEKLDQFLTLATCLREKGYDIDDPTAETLDTWTTDFITVFDWDDPNAVEAYETCSGSEGGSEEGKKP